MKQIAILIIALLISCGNKENTKTQGQLAEYNYKKGTMKKTYFADFNFRGDFQIIFNGLSIKRNNSVGVSNGLEYLNPFIEKSGKQTITLILKPLSGKIMPEEIKDYYIDIVYTDNGEPSPINKVMRCSFPPSEKAVDSLMYTWTFDAEVPFEISTLNDAKDLKDEKPEELLKEVVSEYEKVNSLINNGNIIEYMSLYKKSREREMISMYYDDTKQKEYLSNLQQRVASSKGFMQSLSDYRLLIHPNNKVVSLVTSQGKSPLFSKDENGKIKTYGLQLYRSKITGKLEVY
ncbi:hypothetical protein NAL32_21835 [Chryseobacterium sp. Ch-15]|uniref:Lipoprotein n=1 Tax=Chryseobacterium muglaense TaxID=2893752 RepID=A0A9Q3UTM7_9FLAO|nr:hypothetical protein [Chryseobacterium muglaense]MBD3907347.1 hypothetical protein [Chryseobacterium muglaense]MCC9033510.1 hypothetical protein [Chryseobacterium muglaense]MCM2557031.1 hypothetical protein [Chryseobacterium muglaense]